MGIGTQSRHLHHPSHFGLCAGPEQSAGSPRVQGGKLLTTGLADDANAVDDGVYLGEPTAPVARCLHAGKVHPVAARYRHHMVPGPGECPGHVATEKAIGPCEQNVHGKPLVR